MFPITPSLPEILEPACVLVRGKTDAADRVVARNEDKKRQVPFRVPYVMVEKEGGRAIPEDNRMARARLIFTAKGRTWAETRNISLQIHDVFLPPADVAGGLHERIGGVRFSGALEDGPPREGFDERNLPESVSSYEVTYMREV